MVRSPASGFAESIRQIARGARVLYKLPAFLNRPLSIEACRATLVQRLHCREHDFLTLFRAAVAGNPASPYHELLRQAGCETGDIERLVTQDGLDRALATLFRAGIYLTNDEYKGRQAVVRGSFHLDVTPRSLQNPLTTPDFHAYTGGSRGEPTPIPLALAGIRDRAVNVALAADTRGGSGWTKAIWEMSGISPLLWYSVSGNPVARWFGKVDIASAGLTRRQALRTRAEISMVSWASRLSGRRLPDREYVSMEQPRPIVRWIEQVLAEGGTPHLWTSTSAAVRLCREAERTGVGIRGAQFTVTGEPVTPVRLAAIEQSGAVAVPDYGCADSGGSVSGGCLAPESPDDVHVYEDLNAVIQADTPSFPRNSLLLTSIRPTTPFVFINLVLGDCAILSKRACGCPMEALGWHTHLHGIRSYDKLTAGGLTFMDTDVMRILDEVLPERFGGSPSDYQIVEEMAGDGRPRLRLFMHPDVGPADAGHVMESFLEALGHGSGTERLMASQLRQEGILAVERKAPRATASGKILHLQSEPRRGGEE